MKTYKNKDTNELVSFDRSEAGVVYLNKILNGSETREGLGKVTSEVIIVSEANFPLMYEEV